MKLKETFVDSISGKKILAEYVVNNKELSAAVDAGLAEKEDKVFVAEYGVTTYSDIKAAYDAGKQIVCVKHTDGALQYVYATLSQNIEGVLFIFNSGIATQDWMFICKYNNGETLWEEQLKHYYDTTATSGSQELADAFNAKQDNLTFAGENNIITAINTSAISVPTIIPTATQPADTTACSMYVDVNGKFYIVTANS